MFGASEECPAALDADAVAELERDGLEGERGEREAVAAAACPVAGGQEGAQHEPGEKAVSILVACFCSWLRRRRTCRSGWMSGSTSSR